MTARRTKKKRPIMDFYIAGFIVVRKYSEKLASYGDAVILRGLVKDIMGEIKKCHCTYPSFTWWRRSAERIA